jgi:hypothetical protein
MRIVKTKVYKFAELSETAKQRLLKLTMNGLLYSSFN